MVAICNYFSFLLLHFGKFLVVINTEIGRSAFNWQIGFFNSVDYCNFVEFQRDPYGTDMENLQNIPA